MSQTNELNRVKARIKALAEKTVSNGCTEAEATAAEPGPAPPGGSPTLERLDFVESRRL